MRTAAAILALLTGCFGDGPVPSAPEKATIIYQLTPASQSDCSQQKYIGPVAFGPVFGFAGLLPYQPQEGCNNGGSQVGNMDVPVYEFPREGNGAAQMVGTAGMSDGTFAPRLLALGGMNNNVLWLSTMGNNGGTGGLDLAGAPTAFAYQFASGGNYAPVGLFRDETNFYAAAVQVNTGGRAEPDNPNYPCCGPAQTPMSGGILASLDPDGAPLAAKPLPISPLLDCSHSTRCIVQNTTSLVYLAFENLSSSSWKIASYPKTGTADTDEVLLSHLSLSGSGLVPVGFHATDANVVWAKSRQYDQGGTLPAPACELDRYDLVAGMDLGPIFMTQAFDCAGISTDDESIYFTIVEFVNSNGSEHMRGLGIGRVHLDSKVVETIRFNVFGSSTGPRRVLDDDTDVIVVDPFTIARIPKSALDGQNDFAL